MRTRVGCGRRRIAWCLWLTTLTLVLVSAVLPSGPPEGDTFIDRTGLLVLLVLQALTFATVGLVLVRARPDNSVSWLFSAVGLFVALQQVADSYQEYALVVRPEGPPLGELAAWLAMWLYVPALVIIITLLPQLFPTGRPVSRRWHAVLWLSGVTFIGMTLAAALQPQLGESGRANPVGLRADRFELLDEVATSTYAVATVLAFLSLVFRWRRADAGERQQLKWFAYFASLLPLFVITNGVTEVLGVGEPLASTVIFTMAIATFLGLPLGTAIAILRHRLFDVDVVINRTLVYGVLTAMLIGSYLGLVLLFRLMLSPVTGSSDLAVAGSTLVVAALFRPLRARIQATVDRRFYRARYDATRTSEQFSARLREELDLAAIATDLRQVAQDTMQPAHVSLWLRTMETLR